MAARADPPAGARPAGAAQLVRPQRDTAPETAKSGEQPRAAPPRRPVPGEEEALRALELWLLVEGVDQVEGVCSPGRWPARGGPEFISAGTAHPDVDAERLELFSRPGQAKLISRPAAASTRGDRYRQGRSSEQQQATNEKQALPEARASVRSSARPATVQAAQGCHQAQPASGGCSES